MDGEDIEFREVGPYVFDENREKHLTIWNWNESLIYYNQSNIFYFNANESTGELDEVVNIVNFPFIVSVFCLTCCACLLSFHR